MRSFLKKLLKKNFVIYKFSLFIYQNILINNYLLCKKIIFFILNFKENKKFLNEHKDIEKTFLYDQKFYYPKNSIFLRNTVEQRKNDNSLEKEYDLIRNKFFNKNIGIILDIGANIGYQSLFYRKIFGKNIDIYCFEPHPINFYFLEKNLSNLENFKLMNFALGKDNTEDTMSIPFSELDRLSNLGLMSIGSKSNILKEKIFIKKFDLLKMKEKIKSNTYIKIDVEGYENNVVLGMSKFLDEQENLYLKIEVNRKYKNEKNIQELINFFEKKNYRFFLLEKNIFVNYDIKDILKKLIFRNIELFIKK